MTTLTQRQQEFLSQFLDLYQEAGTTLHYVAVAKRLGVGKVTAYEMLRLLEKRGLVEAEYQLPEGARGPGRSIVVFRPTSRAKEALNHLAGKAWDAGEWETAKARILRQLREGRAGQYEALLDDLLTRFREERSPMVYAAQVITAISLSLHSLKGAVEASRLRDILRAIGFPDKLSLQTLFGLCAGLSLAERANRRWSKQLLAQASKYQAALADLSEEAQRSLRDFAREVFHIVGV